MPSQDAFSPLESLVLVRTVTEYGAKAQTFEQILNALKESTISLEQNDTETRLSGKTLQDRYLRLLKDEARQQLEEPGDQPAVNGEHDQGADDHRTLSPKTPKIEDVAQYGYLVPQLLARLWDDYRADAIRQIKECELQHDELVKQLDEVKHLAQAKPSEPDASTSVIDHGILPDNTDKHKQRTEADAAAGSPQLSNLPQDTSPEALRSSATIEAPPEVHIHRKSSATDGSISSILNTPGPEKSMSKRPVSTGDNAPSPKSNGSPMLPQIPPSSQRRIPPPLAPAVPTQYPPLQPNLAGYRHPSSLVHQSPYEPLPQRSPLAQPPLAQSPHAQYPSQNAYHATSASPSTTPQLQQSTIAQWAPGAQFPGQSATPSMAAAQQPQPLGVRNSQLHSIGTPQGFPPIRPQQYPPSAYSQQQPILPNLAARNTGVQLPPFQLTPQVAITPSQVQGSRSVTGDIPARNQSGLHSTPFSDPRATRPFVRPDVSTPMSANARTPQIRTGPLLYPRPGISFSPGSSTGWKVIPTVPPVELDRPTWTPGFEDAVIDGSVPAHAPLTTSKKGRPSNALKQKTHPQNIDASAQPSPTSTTPRKGKATQVTSKAIGAAAPAARTRTRSQSVVSQAEESGKFKTVAERQIKPEPSTPAEELHDPASDTSTPLPGKARRQQKISAAVPSSKRKRGITDLELEDTSETTTPRTLLPPVTFSRNVPPVELVPTNPSTIIAFRNFQRMTQPIMNNITSHKHASLFANPVKDRDAEGYSDIIRRPQDLKSIRAAIVAGSRAVTALTTAEGPGTPGTPKAGTNTPGGPGGPGGSSAGTSATVSLPWSQELVPPRAIVNGAQLEQEVMRMLANAVMFNAGNDGVVRDTREMFESVEASMAAWRAAERNAAEQRSGQTAGLGSGVLGAKAEDDADELGDVEDSMVQPSAKRRRGI